MSNVRNKKRISSPSVPNSKGHVKKGLNGREVGNRGKKSKGKKKGPRRANPKRMAANGGDRFTGGGVKKGEEPGAKKRQVGESAENANTEGWPAHCGHGKKQFLERQKGTRAKQKTK